MARTRYPYPLEAIPYNGRWGDRFPPRTRSHQGTDWSKYHIDRLRLSVNMTACSGGRVVFNGWSNALGWTVVWLDDNRKYIGYHHGKSRSDLKVGTRVELGQFVMVMGNTGSQSSVNVHLHATCSDERNGWFNGNNEDLVRYLARHLTSGAGGGVKPIPNKPTKPAPAPIAVPVPEEDEVSIIIIALRREGQPDYTAKCSVVAIPGGYEETSIEATADEFYSLAGVNTPHRVFSGSVLKGGNEEATRKYRRALAGFEKGRADYLAAKAEEMK